MADKAFLGVRPYIEQPLLTSEEATSLNIANTLKEYIFSQASDNNLQDYSMYKFDTRDNISPHGNIFSDFVSWKYAHPEFFKKFKMGKHQADMMEYKPKLIAQSLYGDNSLFYTIMIFNDIYHEAELTKERLEHQGITVLSEIGIEALKEIMTFKTKYEYNEDDPFAPSDF